MCGGGRGKTQYSALWMYNKLMHCTTPAKIKSTRNMYVKHMSVKDLQYLNTIHDEAQYPGARCAMSEGTYMYQQSALSAVESMNAANKEMRTRTAVDALNATLLVIRLECDRFDRMKQEAWGDDSFLSLRRKDEYDSTYTDLFLHHYSFFVSNVETHWQVKVQRNNVERADAHYVQLPKEAVNGSFFGTCICGADKTNAVPCEHMTTIALSSQLRPQITPISIMPTWWGREQWRKQFPSNVYCDGSTTMKSIKDSKILDVTLRYCPDWTAPNKSGIPKKAEQRKSGLEEAMAKVKGEKKPPKMKRRRCVICGKWNHKMEDCFVLTRLKNNKEMTMIFPVETTVNVTRGSTIEVTTVNHVTGGGTMEVTTVNHVTGGGTMGGTTVNHVTGGGTMDRTTVYHVTGGGTMEDDGQEGVI
jgi:hypothetical protein